MKRTSHTAALAASLVFSSVVAAAAADDCPYDDMPFETARTSEERLLGSDDGAARFLAHQPFTREIAAAGVVSDALAPSLAEARVPATVLLEIRQALAGTIDLEREISAGDRFYVRYRQPFTVDGAPIGTASLLWLELRTRARARLPCRFSRAADRAAVAGQRRGGRHRAAAPAARRRQRLVGLRHAPRSLDKPGPAMGPLADPHRWPPLRRPSRRRLPGGAFAAAAP